MKQTQLIENILQNRALLELAAKGLRDGLTVVFPTETVYGLGANGLSASAIDGIYEAKGRPSDNPLILHISNEAMLKPLVKHIPDMALKLMAAFWPGPLTLVFEKSAVVPLRATGGLGTVAIRMPRHPLALALIEAAGIPIAAPSANLSGKPSPTDFEHVVEDLFGRVDFIVASEPSEIGLESTVVDVTGEVPVILRPGSISTSDVRRVVGACSEDPALKDVKEQLKPKSPGMKYRHYAPEVPMLLLEGSAEKVLDWLEKAGEQGRTAYLLFEDTWEATGYKGLNLGKRDDLDTVARRLFQNLRHIKAKEYDKIICEIPTETEGIGEAIRNRLLKAAGQSVIKL